MKLALAMVIINDNVLLYNLLQEIHMFFDEMRIGVDDSSENLISLVETVRRWEAQDFIFHHTLGITDPRNQVQEQVLAEWTFVLDSDEFPQCELLEWCRSFVYSPEADGVNGVWLTRHNLIDGMPAVRPDGDHTWERHVRLFRSFCRYDETMVLDAGVMCPGIVIDGPQDLVIQHYKTGERQVMQDARHEAIKTQCRLRGTDA